MFIADLCLPSPPTCSARKGVGMSSDPIDFLAARSQRRGQSLPLPTSADGGAVDAAYEAVQRATTDFIGEPLGADHAEAIVRAVFTALSDHYAQVVGIASEPEVS